MPVDPDLVALMLDTVSFAVPGAKNGYGESTTSSTISVTCRVEPTAVMIRDNEGQERVTNAVIYTDRVYGILPTYIPTLPDGRTHPIMRVATWEDELGPSHEVIYV